MVFEVLLNLSSKFLAASKRVGLVVSASSSVSLVICFVRDSLTMAILFLRKVKGSAMTHVFFQ